MANAIATTYPLNGVRNFQAVIQITGDGSGDESNTVVVTASSLTGSPSTFKIRKIQHSLDGFTATLKWAATTPVQAAALGDNTGELCFKDAPLINNAGAGITGNLTITTSGLNASGEGTIIINGYH